jgi:hypothetical protein
MQAQPTVYHPTASQFAAATSHLDMRSDPDPLQRWANVRIDGVRYVSVTSGNSGRKYLVRADAAGCACVWYQRTLTRCSHMLAVELAALEDELTEQPAPMTRSRYESLFAGRCSRCHELHDERGSMCERCSSDAAYQERLAAKRAMVGARY